MDKKRYGILLNSIVSAKYLPELLAAVHMLHLYFGSRNTGAITNHTQTKTSCLGYADTFQDAATGWSSDDSASESKKEI
ncbi:hypothetical protein TNCV_5017001 [Trichonephila clavipes]|nr:hypothetical protein TNCV_5017001 [Trichonephila clavipes]